MDQSMVQRMGTIKSFLSKASSNSKTKCYCSCPLHMAGPISLGSTSPLSPSQELIASGPILPVRSPPLPSGIREGRVKGKANWAAWRERQGYTCTCGSWEWGGSWEPEQSVLKTTNNTNTHSSFKCSGVYRDFCYSVSIGIPKQAYSYTKETAGFWLFLT